MPLLLKVTGPGEAAAPGKDKSVSGFVHPPALLKLWVWMFAKSRAFTISELGAPIPHPTHTLEHMCVFESSYTAPQITPAPSGKTLYMQQFKVCRGGRGDLRGRIQSFKRPCLNRTLSVLKRSLCHLYLWIKLCCCCLCFPFSLFILCLYVCQVPFFHDTCFP